MKSVLVTGATGFVGRQLCTTLAQAGYRVHAAVRRPDAPVDGAFVRTSIGDIGPATRWATALHGIDTVVHLAARAHVLHDSAANAHIYDEINALGTRRLAEAAAEAGVRRLVYLSSIKVNGEATRGRAYTAEDTPNPLDPYGVSKWRAEQAVWDVAAKSALQGVVVRPPVVYGPGVRANFLRLMRWIDRGWMLPFGRVDNRRSLVSIWNLCDLLSNAIEHPAATGKTWMVCDGEDVSTPDLLRRIGVAMDRRVRLLAVPLSVLRALGTVAGRAAEIERLCGSLVVDATATRVALGWVPPIGLDEGLKRTTRWYLSEGRALDR